MLQRPPCPPVTVSAPTEGGVPDPAGSCLPGYADASLTPLSSPTSVKPEGTPRPSSHRAPGSAAEAQGPRHRARPFARPRRWGSAQRAGAGRGDGVLTPSPSPVPARARREPPLPRACLSAQAHETRKGSHWKQPRPRAEYLRTPSPARAADYGRLLRMRDAGPGACAFRGIGRS